MRHRKGTYKLWFDYLVLAIRSGVPINWRHYAEWGTKDELLSSTFNRWWKNKGMALCAAVPPQSERDAVELKQRGDGYVVLRISTDVPIRLISRHVSEIVRGARTARRTREFAKVAPSSQVNYKTLAAYKRMLELSLMARSSNLSISDKIDRFKNEYRKIDDRMKQQRTSLRKQGERGRRLAKRWRSHDPDTFDSVDYRMWKKKAYRWLVSAEHVMLNVAEGRFPGGGYYGSRLSERLEARKRAMGLDS